MSKLSIRAKKYFLELPPHVKERKGGFYISELVKESEKQNTLLKDIFTDITKDNMLSPDTFDRLVGALK